MVSRGDWRTRYGYPWGMDAISASIPQSRGAPCAESDAWRNSLPPDFRADLSGAYLSGANLSGANLSGAYLSGAYLSDASLRMADLSGARLIRANLNGADLTGANLHGANLSGAELSGANLIGANLSGADLSGANLIGANLVGASLHCANLSDASLFETIFGNVNLTHVIGLATCQQFGPSVIDYRTLQKSGPLPIAFLRGVGLPDIFIEYLPSLTNQAIQLYSCFISYSTEDQDFAERLHADLQSKGVRCWFSPHDIRSGKKLHEQTDEAIKLYDKLLLILSEASMSSEWVKTEISNARQRELSEKRQMLFPISLVSFEHIKAWKAFDVDTGKDSAREIREYFIPDFANWKDHDAYKQSLERVVRDLTISPKVP
jgi:TIR domain/Pentapeptide repeats (8 copies)